MLDNAGAGWYTLYLRPWCERERQDGNREKFDPGHLTIAKGVYSFRDCGFAGRVWIGPAKRSALLFENRIACITPDKMGSCLRRLRAAVIMSFGNTGIKYILRRV
ncbi:MAG: hypothetical protein BWY06_01616 [Candidatus Latescibacteria bacterium ADurb.Bin168]|nr:MAG: hypothetical protein BWY06_01616 [Candidatus Latescibacteria bacterium ADurb.Bin168]